MTNPLLAPWDTPFGLPPFDKIEAGHFQPAFEALLAEHKAEVARIRDNPAPADFDNTVAALERAGLRIDRVAGAFFTLASGNTSPEIQEVERWAAPALTRHMSGIVLDQGLWARVKAAAESGPLEGEPARIMELTLREFRRAGADLDDAGRARMAEIDAELAETGTAFAQNMLADESDWSLTLAPEDLAGLPDILVAQAREEAKSRDIEGAVITLARSSVEPFLTYADRRDLRETAWRAWNGRGEEENWPLIRKTLCLRAEKARLLGYAHFAEYKLEDQMAKTPAAVRDLLMRVWRPARARALEEAADLAALAAAEGANIEIAPWDWRYYAEKVRRERFALDDAQIKPYLELGNVIEASFAVARRLFGLEFRPVEGLPLPHADARAWEVLRDGVHLGLFVGDYFARRSKRSGAWMNALRSQQKLSAPERPIIMNTANFAKGEPTLLSFDDARTIFHEFGHALHGLMSEVTHPSISGTNVARDFVELPSQLYEHWLSLPEVLEEFARHHETGEAMPRALIEKIKKSEKFNQGFLTSEFLASALVDLAMHEADGEGDPEALEAAVLREIGQLPAIPMRHRSPHFAHVFAGSGYAAGYYSYMWSEVMDADAFHAFTETGDPFDAATAARFAAHVLSAGGSTEPEAAYLAFRGKMPGVEPLLEGRGLA